jgi:hypothetical protein
MPVLARASARRVSASTVAVLLWQALRGQSLIAADASLLYALLAWAGLSFGLAVYARFCHQVARPRGQLAPS